MNGSGMEDSTAVNAAGAAQAISAATPAPAVADSSAAPAACAAVPSARGDAEREARALEAEFRAYFRGLLGKSPALRRYVRQHAIEIGGITLPVFRAALADAFRAGTEVFTQRRGGAEKQD